VTLPKAAPDKHSIIQLVPGAENDIVAGAAAARKDVSGKLLRQAKWGGAPWQPVSNPARSFTCLKKKGCRNVDSAALFSLSRFGAKGNPAELDPVSRIRSGNALSGHSFPTGFG